MSLEYKMKNKSWLSNFIFLVFCFDNTVFENNKKETKVMLNLLQDDKYNVMKYKQKERKKLNSK